MDEKPSVIENAEMVDSSNGKGLVTNDGHSDNEPYVGMEFESEEAAKVVWRRLVCNREGFRKLRPKRIENRKPRAVTREGCKAMIVVKKEKTGKWVVTKFVKEHNHSLVVPANTRHSAILSQTPDDKDVKIRELTAELQRERKRSAAIQQQLDMVLKDMEEHSKRLSRNIDDIVKSVKEIESRTTSD